MKKHVRDAMEAELARNAQLAAVAKAKVFGTAGEGEADASIGHSFFFPGERITKQRVETRDVQGEFEPVYVTVTEMQGPPIFERGGKSHRSRMGRVLLSYDPDAHVSYGGAFFVEYAGKTCVNSVYVVPAYRKAGFGALLAETLKSEGVDCAFEPMSTEGAAWSERNGMRRVKG